MFALASGDRIDAGTGNDRVFAGRGNDSVDAGAGFDRVHADPADSVAADCEVVRVRTA